MVWRTSQRRLGLHSTPARGEADRRPRRHAPRRAQTIGVAPGMLPGVQFRLHCAHQTDAPPVRRVAAIGPARQPRMRAGAGGRKPRRSLWHAVGQAHRRERRRRAHPHRRLDRDARIRTLPAGRRHQRAIALLKPRRNLGRRTRLHEPCLADHRQCARQHGGFTRRRDLEAGRRIRRCRPGRRARNAVARHRQAQ